MSKIGKWITGNEPAPVVVSGELLKSLAQEVGATLVVTPSKGMKFSLEGGNFLVKSIVRSPKAIFRPAQVEYTYVRLIDGGFTITWTHYVDEKEGRVRYYPYLSVMGWEAYEFTQAILKALGIKKSEVSFPEAVIQLPVPNWVFASSDDQWASVYGGLVFASEAEEYLASFIVEFRQKVAEQLAPKDPEPESAGVCFCGLDLSPDGHCHRGCI